VEPREVIECLNCIKDGKDCGVKLFLLKEAIFLKSLDECLEVDSDCKKCFHKFSCKELTAILKKRGVI
jgi:hypothetical protein